MNLYNLVYVNRYGHQWIKKKVTNRYEYSGISFCGHKNRCQKYIYSWTHHKVHLFKEWNISSWTKKTVRKGYHEVRNDFQNNWSIKSTLKIFKNLRIFHCLRCSFKTPLILTPTILQINLGQSINLGSNYFQINNIK